MKIQSILSFFVLLVSVTSAAVGDFSGHWVGSGKVNSNIGLNSNCSKIEIIITQTPDSLVTQKYESTCNLFGSSWGPIDMKIQDDKVFEDEEEVGTISNDTLLTLLPSGTVVYAYNLKLIHEVDGSTSLQTYYGAQNSIGAMATEGILKKVSP